MSSENEYFHEIKRYGRTSFMDFMPRVTERTNKFDDEKKREIITLQNFYLVWNADFS